MKKSNIILLRITAIISMLISVLFFFECVGLAFNVLGFKDLYISILQQIGVPQTDVNAQVFMGIFDGLIGLFLNSYCAGTFYRLSRAKNYLVGSAKAVLYMGILQCLFIISIIPGILAIIVGNMLAKQEREVANRPREVEQGGLEDVAYQITELKKQRESNQITQMQYERALNNLLDRSAQAQINNEIHEKNTKNQDNNQI